MRGSTAEIRLATRQARAKPLLDELRIWLEATLGKLSRKSDTAAAIRYALSRWRALTRYVDDGQLEIDNNAAERALRVVALGRKNFLFAGSDSGGERAAAIYSLLGSAKLNGLDPEIYLHEVLEHIADHPISRINDLLPWNLAHRPTSPSELCIHIRVMWIHNSDTPSSPRPRQNAYADSTRVHARQPVNTSLFAAYDCSLLIPRWFPQGN
jgi:hypothetical protein